MTDAAVQQLDTLLHDQPKSPLRPAEVAEYAEERDRLRTIVHAPAWQTGADRGAATKTYRRIEKVLQDGAPKPLNATTQDKVATLAQDVLTRVIRPAMLPRAIMRRNPAGAVDAFRRGENSKQIKGAIMTWKRAMRALDPSNDDSDYTNLERFRPEGTNPDGTSTFMLDAQIPGKFAQSPMAKANWPLGEPTIDTAVKQVVRREISEKQRAALIRARAAAAAKRASLTSTASHDVPAEAATE